MAKNEEGEFELILGNKQLLSVFFIVVILLGVFFTMGYVVGRNSAPIESASNVSETSSASGSAKPAPMIVDPPKTTAPAGVEPNSTPTMATPPPGVTQQAAPSKQAEAAVVSQGGVVTPQPGEMYIQVLALAKPEAEVLVDVLGKKGFRAVVAPGPNDRVYRVLVGPAKDTTELGKLRNDVEASGFKGAFPKKY